MTWRCNLTLTIGLQRCCFHLDPRCVIYWLLVTKKEAEEIPLSHLLRPGSPKLKKYCGKWIPFKVLKCSWCLLTFKNEYRQKFPMCRSMEEIIWGQKKVVYVVCNWLEMCTFIARDYCITLGIRLREYKQYYMEWRLDNFEDEIMRSFFFDENKKTFLVGLDSR